MKFDMSRAWNEATALLSVNREVTWAVAGVFFFLPAFAQSIMMPAVQPPVGADQQAMIEYITEVYSSAAPIFLITTLVQLVGSLTLLALLRDDSKPTVGEALKTGAIGLLPYIGVYLIIVVAMTIAFLIAIGIPAALGLAWLAVILMIALVPLLIYGAVKLSLVTPVIAIEKQMNPIYIIQRSWRLTKGNSLRLLLYYFLLVVVYFVLALVVGGIIGVVLALFGEGAVFDIGSGIVAGLIGAAASLVFTAVIAAIHRQLAGPSTGTISQTFG